MLNFIPGSLQEFSRLGRVNRPAAGGRPVEEQAENGHANCLRRAQQRLRGLLADSWREGESVLRPALTPTLSQRVRENAPAPRALKNPAFGQHVPDKSTAAP